MSNLVAPRAREELIAAFARGAQQAEPELVDRERVGWSGPAAWRGSMRSSSASTPLHPLSRRLGSVELPKLSRGEEPMLIQGLEDLAPHRAKPPNRHSGVRLELRAVHRLVLAVKEMAALANRPDSRSVRGYLRSRRSAPPHLSARCSAAQRTRGGKPASEVLRRARQPADCGPDPTPHDE